MMNVLEEREIQQYNFFPTINGLRSFALSELRNGNYKGAEIIYKRALSIIKEKETEFKYNLHKGNEHYFIGISILYQKKRRKKALEFFYLAYIEDLLNVQYNEEKAADSFPAFKTLNYVFKIDIKFLNSLKNQIKNQKEDIKKWRKIKSTTNIRRNIKILFEHATLPKLEIPIPIDEINRGTFPSKNICVFFGGSFKMTAYLRELRRIFIQEKPNYVTFMSLDFTFKQSETHDACMKILSKCGHAVFEVSDLGGQFAEMEMAKIQRIHTILLFSITTKKEKKDPRLSIMAKTMGFPLEGFRYLNEVPDLYHKHFP